MPRGLDVDARRRGGRLSHPEDETVADGRQAPGFAPQTPGVPHPGFAPQTPGVSHPGFAPQTPGAPHPGFRSQTPGGPQGSLTQLPPPSGAPGSVTGWLGDTPTWAALSGSGERSRLPAPGELVGPYRVERELARGGMGAVYVAHHVQLGRMVALKLMLADRAENPKAVERFQIEAEAVARLRHPGIVGVHEAGFHGFSPFLAMEFVRGESLKSLLEREGPLPPQRAVELAAQLADAMAHAHAQGVLHRDLKPDNVLLEGGVPRVTDFGLAKQLQDSTRESLTKTGQTMGTPGYMPPEQASGERHDFGFPSDVWGLGATLYALLTGKPPFSGETSVQVITKILTLDPEPPSAHAPAVDAALDRIVLTCLEKDTGDRYPTMDALAADLRRHLSGESVEAGPTRAQRRQRRRLIGMVAALTAVAALGGLAFVQRARLAALLGSQQAEHARAQAVEHAQRALAELGAAGTVAELDGWLRDHSPAVGPQHPLVLEVAARRARLALQAEAEAGLTACRDDPNLERRHLAVASWLDQYDRSEDAEPLAALLTEARQFHAERWLVRPLRTIPLVSRRARDDAETRVCAAAHRDGEVWSMTSAGQVFVHGLPGGALVADGRTAPSVGTTNAWLRRGEAVWRALDERVFQHPQAAIAGDAVTLGAARSLGFPTTVETLAVDPGGQRALAAGGDQGGSEDATHGWVRFLELNGDRLQAGEPIAVAAIVKAAVALPDGRYVTVGGNTTGLGADVLLWAHDRPEPLARFHLGNRGESVAVAPGGRVIAVGTSNRGVLLFDVPALDLPPAITLRATLRLPSFYDDDGYGVQPWTYGVLFHDAWLVASLHQRAPRGERNALSGIVLWRWAGLRGDQDVAALLHRSHGVPYAADEGLALTPDGRYLVQPTLFGELLVWDGPSSMPQALRARGD